jgi:beta-xylosidase
MRHVMEWEESRDACAFDPSDRNQAKIIEEFEKRILQAARPDEAEETRKHLHDLIEEWFQEARNTGRGHLTFNSGKQFVNLLTQYPMDVSWPGFWPTLNSMRHVDGETPFAVKGQS